MQPYQNNVNTFPNSQYPPFGYNDNNFNRKRMPSNIYPPNGGMNGNYMGQFNPNTYNENNQRYFTKFNNAYKANEPMIEPIDYNNKDELYHNNVADIVLDEHIIEYKIIIDSKDRDIKIYPNPFDFKVKFNPNSDSILRTEKIQNGKKVLIREKMNGDPTPHIIKEFKNVKYIKLETIVLPTHKNIIFDEETEEYEFDNNELIVTDRFTALHIKELDIHRVYSTATTRADRPPEPYALIFADKHLGKNHFFGTPYYGSIIYKNSDLENITSLTIKLYDSCGNPLNISELYTAQEVDEMDIPETDIRHPLNIKHQVHMSFIFGVVESQINTETKFYE